jgi:trehalose 6-phosphate phosphatase
VIAEYAARVAADADAFAFCLDFDGTLAPIVDDPDEAEPLPGTVELIGQLAARFAAVALLSGRPANYLAKQLSAPGLRYLGLYGLQEIRHGRVWVDPRLKAARPAVMVAWQALSDCAAVRDSGAYLHSQDQRPSFAAGRNHSARLLRWDGAVMVTAAAA